ncbi:MULTISPECIES: hypothetical protein [Alcanivoracaceae]|uniref:hypothetical protein n=1 Tax=Alcanivoracaceae TaxID=224372 RepID=UPI00135AB151|nr:MULTISPECIES: hypothetical protein [Alcanivoracaceae]
MAANYFSWRWQFACKQASHSGFEFTPKSGLFCFANYSNLIRQFMTFCHISSLFDSGRTRDASGVHKRQRKTGYKLLETTKP